MAELLRLWSYLTQLDSDPHATDDIHDSSSFDNASAECEYGLR